MARGPNRASGREAHKAQEAVDAASATRHILRLLADEARQTAARELLETSNRLSADDVVRGHLREASEALSQTNTSTSAVYGSLAWVSESVLVRPCRDAFAWEVIASMEPGSDLDTVLQTHEVYDNLDAARRSQLHNACNKILRLVRGMGHGLQGYKARSHTKQKQRDRWDEYRKRHTEAGAQEQSEPALLPAQELPRESTRSMDDRLAAIQEQNDILEHDIQSCSDKSDSGDEERMDDEALAELAPVWQTGCVSSIQRSKTQRADAASVEYQDHAHEGSGPQPRTGPESIATASDYGFPQSSGPAAYGPAPCTDTLQQLRPQSWGVLLLLDEAFADVCSALHGLPEDQQRSGANKWRWERAPFWINKAQNAEFDANLPSKWVCSGYADDWQRRILVVYSVLGVQSVLSVSSQTFDALLSSNIYSAIKEYRLYLDSFGLETSDAKTILQFVLTAALKSFTDKSWFEAYVALLGQLLEGAGRPNSWARTVGLTSAEEQPKLEHSLLGRAVYHVLLIANWWHDNYKAAGARVVHQALMALLQMFKGAKTLDMWEHEIKMFARKLLWDNHWMSQGIQAANDLLQI